MMKKITHLIFSYLLLSSSLIFVANRASGVISNNTSSDLAISAIDLPAGGNPIPPICTVSMQESKRVFADDRANYGVVGFDTCDFSPVDKLPQAPGVPTCTLCKPH